MEERSIVTISFFRYPTLRRRWWAFRQMGLAPAAVADSPGLEFFKMLGSGGGNGFSIWPNWGVYGLLGVWTTEEDARAFLSGHETFGAFCRHSSEYLTVYMRTAVVHGRWAGAAPFRPARELDPDRPIGVLTRATIHPRQLWRFWRFVPPVSRSVAGREGLLFSVGIGELPIVQQATFSLWQNSHQMKAFAYQSPYHREVVRRTRELGWYTEELFARFHPYAVEGTWEGRNPLAGYI